MAKQIGEDTKVTLDLKTIGIAGAGLAALIGMYFTLQADIALAKELPEPPPPDVTRMEFDMKDKLVRQTIMTTQEDVSELMCDSHTCDYHGHPSIIYAIAFIAICLIGSIIINKKAWRSN